MSEGISIAVASIDTLPMFEEDSVLEVFFNAIIDRRCLVARLKEFSLPFPGGIDDRRFGKIAIVITVQKDAVDPIGLTSVKGKSQD
jgi:hypothetical protein